MLLDKEYAELRQLQTKHNRHFPDLKQARQHDESMPLPIGRMPKVGERLQLAGRTDPVTVLEVNGNIVVYDEWLPKYNEFNRCIARFDTNSTHRITYNVNLSFVKEPND
jgi:hypothetical protein